MRSPTLNTTSVGGHYIQAAALAAKSFIAAALTLSLMACASTDTRRSTGETLDDAAVASRVKAALIGNAETDGLDIEVEVNRGTVQLNGFTTTSEESALAEQIASNVSGVRDVDNNLDVVDPDRSVGEYIDDKVLLTRINGALVKDPDVSAANVEVEVNRGLVQLGGYVASDSERRAAEAAANRVDGVRRVINNIGIRAKS